MARLFDGHPASQPCWHIGQLMKNKTNVRISTTSRTSRHAQTPQVRIVFTHIHPPTSTPVSVESNENHKQKRNAISVH